MLESEQVEKIKKQLKSEDESLIDIFSVLGDKTRYKIVELLAKNKTLCVSDLAAVLEMSISCISQHLRVLEMSGLVESQRYGKTICYKNNSDHLKMKSILELIA